MKQYISLILLILGLAFTQVSYAQSSVKISINEFMYDPPSGSEYVELYNYSDTPIDIQGWTLSDNRSTQELITNSSFTVPADSFVVLAPDSSLVSNPAYADISLVEVSGFPALNNTGDAIVIQESGGSTIDSVDYSPDWGGSDIALERRSPTANGNFEQNWGDSPDEYGTPGNPNQIPEDVQPPKLASLIIGNNQLAIHFSESLDKRSATNTANYALTNGPPVAEADFVFPDSLYLQLASTLQNNTRYTLSIDNVTDIFGNSADIDSSFIYYEVSEVDSGDVAINEFMAAPATGSSEYVEIYNHSSKSLDLQGWTISDSRGNQEVVTNSQFIIPPDSFAVITPNDDLQASYPNIALIDMGSSFPSLNDSGDDITIRDNSGELLDSFSYSSNWIQSDVALERRSVTVSAQYVNNWGDAPSGFGSPGSQNGIPVDDAPPMLQSLTIPNSTTLSLSFSEQLDRNSASNINNYNFVGGPSVNSANVSSNLITLQLGSSLQNAETYRFSVNGVDDLFGNSVSKDTSFTYYNPTPVDSGDVAINEFMAAPPSSSSEYVELYNHSDKSLDLQNWTLSDNGQSRSPITGSQFIVPPDSFVVIAPDNSLQSSYQKIALVVMSGFPSFNNGGDVITIRNENETLLDSLTYGSGWGEDEVALERRTTEVSATVQNNWGDAPNNFGTPGTANEVTIDSKSPRLENLIVNSETVTLIFSEQLDPATANNDNNYVFSDGPTITRSRFAAPDSVFLQFDTELQNTTGYSLSIKNITDIFDNAIAPTDTSFTFYEVSSVSEGDVFVNEFMYDPPSESVEYVELYNPTNKSLDIQGWTLNDDSGSPQTITDTQYIVPPDSFIVISADESLKTQNPNIALIRMGNGFPSLNNDDDAIVVNNGKDLQLDSLSYNSGWGGDQVALERRTTDVSGTYQGNWGNAPNGVGTPGTPNTIKTDTESPTLRSLAIKSNTKIALRFSEQLQVAEAKDPANYGISGAPRIQHIRYTNPDSVMLTLAQSLQNATDYTLSIRNISDIFGNAIAVTDTSITFYEVSAADSGDVFVNEFNYQPSSGNTEYIELYNPTDRSFNLQNWTLADNRGTDNVITSSQYIIPPDSFVVIAPDNTLLSSYPDASLVTMSSFPSLNNSGDDIILKNARGTRLDSLQYTSDWGGNEVPLERRSIAVNGTFSENWGDAPSGVGTPGTTNNVEADDTPPFFERITTKDATTLKLNFSERITTKSATQQRNYDLSPDIGIQLISARDDSVTLYLARELTSGDTYEITVSNIHDIFGNTLSGAAKLLTYLRIDRARAGDIVINEVLYNPGDDGRADFVELYNTTDQNFDLSNWRIGDSSGDATLPSQLQLPAKSYIVLTGADRFASTTPNGRDVAQFPSYNNNSGDAVYIQTDEGRTIDSLRYETSWGGSTEGTSMERKDPLAASNDGSNWQTSNEVSAGDQNISFQPDNSAPEVIFSNVHSNGNIEVRFSEFISLTNETSFQANGNILEVVTFDSTQANVIYLSGNVSQAKNKAANETTITVRNLSDVKGNTASSSEVAVAQPLQQSDLVINEIMFNPLDEPDDNRADQSEYLELRNTRDYAISLEGLFLHDAPDEDGNIRDLQPVVSTAKWVPANSQVLIHADEATSFDESMTADFFDLASPAMWSIMRIDRSSLSLASSGDAIYIADSTGATIDSVYYSESWHNPNIIDSRGIALERVSPKGPSDDASNWGSSVNAKGGTPKKENSIYQSNANQPQENGISFEPNPFSPDGDGYEDNLFINYKLDQQDYLIKVHIYDRYGRLVRELADGQQAGLEGQLIWNGRKDDDSRNRIGIYIVVFEAYDSTSGADKSFKKTVVLARQLN